VVLFHEGLLIGMIFNIDAIIKWSKL